MTHTALKDLAPTATLRYNGFDFGGEGCTPPEYRLQAVPEYEPSGRAVRFVRYRLEVSTVLHASEEADTADLLRDVRRRLSRPGRTLELRELGLGDCAVGDAQTPDAVSGVLPKQLKLEPIGGVLAWQLTWECEFHVAEGAARLAAGWWMAFHYAAEHRIDGGGYTTRTVRGEIEVLASRANSGATLPQTVADAARDRLRVIVPEGFARQSSEWREAPDRRRLEFTIVDAQLRGGPLPPGIAAGEAQWRVRSDAAPAASSVATLSGWLEPAASAPRWRGAQAMLELAQRKLALLQQQFPGRLAIPRRVEFAHELFARRSEFTIEMALLAGAADLLAAGGLWQPVAGTNYRQWRETMEPLWNNRGGAQLRGQPRDAAILDLVDAPTDRFTVHEAGGAIGNAASPAPFGARLVPNITPANSWWKYAAAIEAHRREQTTVHTLAADVVESGAPVAGDGATNLGPAFVSSAGGAGQIHERHGSPRQQVVLAGEAVRVRYQPTAPRLARIGAARAYLLEMHETREQLGEAAGWPVFRLQWRHVYDVLGYIREVGT